MIHLTTRQRRIASDAARVGAVLSASMLMLAGVAAWGGGTEVSAAVDGGAVQVLTPVGGTLTSGTVDTPFLLRPPAAAACAGDSATGGFRIESYMVSANIDPNTLTFDASGPKPGSTGATFRQPLYSGGNPYVDGNTAVGTGALVGIPTFDFTVWAGSFGVAAVPAGNYNLGIACWDLVHQTLDRYWNVVFTFASPASGITWSTAGGVTPTTTTTNPGGTTTTNPGGTTTTNPGGTTTTVDATTTSVETATTLVGSSAGSGSGSGSGGTLVTTGSSPANLILWSVLLLVFGRMAILLGRPVRVIPLEDR